MTKRNKRASVDLWAYARTKYHLTFDQIVMAKQIGMNPKKLGKIAPNRSEQWKGPLGEFIEECYNKRFKKKDQGKE